MSVSPQPPPAIANRSSTPANGTSTHSNSELAALLAKAYIEVDSLKQQLNAACRRAERAERLSAASTSPSASHNVILDLETRLKDTEIVRDEAEARLARIQEYWMDLDRWFSHLETKMHENRSAFSKIVVDGGGPLQVTRLPLVSDLSQALSPQNHAHGLSAPSGRHPQHHSPSTSSRAPPELNALLPSLPSAKVRHRSDNAEAFSQQPPHKRSRHDSGGRSREARAMYSESPVSTPMYANPNQQHYPPKRSPVFSAQYPPSHPASQGQADYTPSHTSQRSTRASHLPSSHQYPPHSNSRSNSRSRSRTRSRSRGSSGSMSVDDMILQTAEGGGASDRRASIDPQSLGGHTSRRRGAHSSYSYTRGEGYQLPPPNQQGPAYPNSQLHPQPQTQHGSPHPSRQRVLPHPVPTYTAQPGESAGSAVGGTQQSYQTHIFAPPVMGAPVKKSKYSAGSTGIVSPPSNGSLNQLTTSPSPSAATVASTTTVVPGSVSYTGTNAQGQRTCRRCGQPGRYKDGKCVEKWGPGPDGPGTCCDRCRKKMKRFERRGTVDNSSASFNPVPPKIAVHAQSPGTSGPAPRAPPPRQQQTPDPESPQLQHTQPPRPPSSQGFERPVMRPDTLVVPSPSGGVTGSGGGGSGGHSLSGLLSDPEGERPPSTRGTRLSPVGSAGGGEEHKENRHDGRRGSASSGSLAGRTGVKLEGGDTESRAGEVDDLDADADAEEDPDLFAAVDAAGARRSGSG